MKLTGYPAGGFPVYRADFKDYSEVSSFLNEGRWALKRIEFFYPYKREELRNVLRNGYFLCAKDGEKIIATFALDTDRSYARQLADVIKKCTLGKLSVPYAYETSGLMVDERYRRRGIAGDMADAVISIAGEVFPEEYLCGVVQLENVGSMSTFLSRGFLLGGIFSMGGEYDFGYFIRPSLAPMPVPSGEEVKVAFRDIPGHLRALNAGKLGVGIDGEYIVYR